jgi:hypothetical protein
MKEIKSYENFPTWMVVLCNLVPISIYTIGAYILAGFGVWLSILYLLYCLWIETRVLKVSCVNCYYYGKICGFGKGKLCSLLLNKGDPQRFVEKEISWFQILPDFLVSIFPIIGGIVLSVRDFSWIRVLALAVLVVLGFGGTAVMRGSFACKYCKQRELGCPAQELFGGETDG